MDDKARLQLQNMIKTNNVEDQTGLIRDLKHSVILKENIARVLELKKLYGSDQEKLNMECMHECSFLFNYYTDIYNKIRKDEIDLKILYRFLDVLKDIEEGTVDQHEGSFIIGTLLKELYVDSALKKADKLNKEHETGIAEPVAEPIQISWAQYKMKK